jgi:2-hydroxychromene-2-carboxylate isomerase
VCVGGPSRSVPFSRRRDGRQIRPSTGKPPKANTCGAIWERICADLGLPFRRPDPFPQPSLLAGRVALLGLADGWGESFARSVYRAEFGDGLQIGEQAVVAELIAQLNMDPAAVLAKAQSEAIKSQLRTQTERAQRLGIFGAPSFVSSDGELFWGNDRLEAALAWAKRLHDA